jgi:DUF1680 family protein
MLGRGPNRRYADVMEQALYNGALTGLARDGKTFFYDNPLESTGKHHRWVWHHCPCCPPNIARLVASIGSYMYAVADNEIAVHLYGESSLRTKVAGRDVLLTQHTDYPWNGDIRIEVDAKTSFEFGIALRLPEWVEGATLAVNGETVNLESVVIDGYARLARTWEKGDTIELRLPLELRPQYASPKVRQDVGRVALARGPLIYCVEETDNGGDLNAFVVPKTPSAHRIKSIEGLDGALAVELNATKDDDSAWSGSLYSSRPAEQVPATVTLVPYHLWDNREPGSMLVWLQSEK